MYLKIRESVLKYLLKRRRVKWFLVAHKGAEFLLNSCEKTDRFVYLRNNEGAQIELMSDWVMQYSPVCFLDVGANFGLYSIILGRRYPDMRIHSFEPVERLRRQFQANILINGLENLQLHPVAVSDVSAQASYLQHVSGHAGLSKLRQSSDLLGPEWAEMTVETRPMDQMLDYRGERLAIKVDVEGHECEVIRGMCQLLKNNNCYLQVEISSRHPENRAFIKDFMSGCGYELSGIIGKDHIFVARDQS